MSPTTTFQSVTEWQAMPFLVEVRYGFFSTKEEAAAMAKSGIESLVLAQCGLWVNLRNGTRAPVRDDSFKVKRARDEPGESGYLEFDPVSMTISDMLTEPAMRSFGSCSWGVCDEDGNMVLLKQGS